MLLHLSVIHSVHSTVCDEREVCGEREGVVKGRGLCVVESPLDPEPDTPFRPIDRQLLDPETVTPRPRGRYQLGTDDH